MKIIIKAIGILVLLAVMFVVSIMMGMTIGKILFSTAGLIGIGGFSDAMVKGFGIGLILFPILSSFVLHSIFRAR